MLPNHLGDVVMATPALRALRRGRPEAEITVVVRRALVGVLRGSPNVDRFVAHDIYRGRSKLGQFAERARVARSLSGVDTVLVLPNSFASALLAFLTRAPARIGYARRARSWLLTQAVPAPRVNGHFAPLAMERYYLELARRLGAPDLGTQLELFLEPEAERECDSRFAAAGVGGARPLVCLAPGAGFGPSKLWPLDYVAEVARGLRQDGADVALVHGPGEGELAEQIAKRAGVPLAMLGGDSMSLSLLKSVLARAQLLVCNDAGARHIAAAFELPTLVLMGPTAVGYTNLNLKRTKLLREPVECSPCQLKVCPIDHRCMTRLLPARVLGEARAALSQRDWQGSVELELAK
ncbi:MAG TPA: lipopolysaccharide heptosyltransferase II [Myxococcota bacterium]|nr:lipopolysaccharide heptosyltransferase II [Myxococcota bacterium]